MLDPGFLKRMQGSVFIGQTFYGGYGPSDHRCCRGGTGPNGGPIHVHGAGSAEAATAAEFGAGQPNGVTNDPKQRRLGLDVHDVGSYRGEAGPRVLEPNMAFTVEPGLYVAPDANLVDERFRGIGIRIEDDVVITADGHENLNADLPKRPDDVAALVG